MFFPRLRRRAGPPAAALAALLASAPCPALAQAPSAPGTPPGAAPSPQTADEAERLFRQAKPLLDAGQYNEACPKLERSQALDPALGTQFNLADCLEHTGQIARAYQLFADVAALARAAGRAERERAARERLARLEGQVGFLLFSTASLAALPEAALRRDGEPVPREAWARPIVVAAGRHALTASSPRHEPWSASVEVGARVSVEVRVPALAPAAPSPGAARAAAGAADRLPSRRPPPGATQRGFALAAAGAGLAGLALGATFGALSLGGGGPSDPCPQASGCPDESAARARAQGDVAAVGFVAGGLGLGAAALLWWTAPGRAGGPGGQGSGAPGPRGLSVAPPLGGAPWQIAWRTNF